MQYPQDFARRFRPGENAHQNGKDEDRESNNRRWMAQRRAGKCQSLKLQDARAAQSGTVSGPPKVREDVEKDEGLEETPGRYGSREGEVAEQRALGVGAELERARWRCCGLVMRCGEIGRGSVTAALAMPCVCAVSFEDCVVVVARLPPRSPAKDALERSHGACPSAWAGSDRFSSGH